MRRRFRKSLMSHHRTPTDDHPEDCRYDCGENTQNNHIPHEKFSSEQVRI
jgi:hypothetical protein